MLANDLFGAVARSAWLGRFRAALRRDRGFHLVIAMFALASAALGAAFGRPPPLALAAVYLDSWGEVAAWLLIAAACVTGAFAITRAPEGRPLRAFARAVARVASPERMAGFVLFLGLAMFMAAFTNVKSMFPLFRSFAFDPALARLDRSVHFGADPWTLLQPLLGRPEATRWIELAYTPGWMVLTIGLPMVMCVAVKDGVLRRRFLTAYLLAWLVNGVVVASLFLSAGPALYGAIVGDTARFAGVNRYLAFDLANSISAAAEQQRLLASRHDLVPSIGAGISAFPSLHVTMAVICAYGCWGLNRALGWTAIAFAAVIAVGSVHLGWHYAIGDYYAIASATAFWSLAKGRGFARSAAASLSGASATT